MTRSGEKNKRNKQWKRRKGNLLGVLSTDPHYENFVQTETSESQLCKNCSASNENCCARRFEQQETAWNDKYNTLKNDYAKFTEVKLAEIDNWKFENAEHEITIAKLKAEIKTYHLNSKKKEDTKHRQLEKEQEDLKKSVQTLIEHKTLFQKYWKEERKSRTSFQNRTIELVGQVLNLQDQISRQDNEIALLKQTERKKDELIQELQSTIENNSKPMDESITELLNSSHACTSPNVDVNVSTTVVRFTIDCRNTPTLKFRITSSLSELCNRVESKIIEVQTREHFTYSTFLLYYNDVVLDTKSTENLPSTMNLVLELCDFHNKLQHSKTGTE